MTAGEGSRGTRSRKRANQNQLRLVTVGGAVTSATRLSLCLCHFCPLSLLMSPAPGDLLASDH